MAQDDEITHEGDRLVPVVALDQMIIADELGLHSGVEEGHDTNRAEYEQDSGDVDIGVVMEDKLVLNNYITYFSFYELYV
jgi:hypothetical protein